MRARGSVHRMRHWMVACSLALATPLVTAQSPGFVAYTVTGLGSAGGTAGVVGEARIPVRASDVTSENGTVRIVASSARASIRRITLGITGPMAGQRYEVGEGTTLLARFASGNERAPDPGRGWIQVDVADPSRIAGTFEATFHQGRIPIDVRGRFEAPLP